MIYLVAIQKRGKITFIRLLDIDNGKAVDVDAEANLDKISTMQIANARVHEGRIVGLTGSLDKCLNVPMAVILNSIVKDDKTVGYTVATSDGRKLNLDITNTVKLFSTYVVQNATIVDDKFIRGINWEIPVKQFSELGNKEHTDNKQVKQEKTKTVTNESVNNATIKQEIAKKETVITESDYARCMENNIKGVYSTERDFHNKIGIYTFYLTKEANDNTDKTLWNKVDTDKYVKQVANYKMCVEPENILKASNINEVKDGEVYIPFIELNFGKCFVHNGALFEIPFTDDKINKYGEGIKRKILLNSKQLKLKNKSIKTFKDTGLAVPNKQYRYDNLEFHKLKLNLPSSKYSEEELNKIKLIISQSEIKLLVEVETNKIILGSTNDNYDEFYVLYRNKGSITNMNDIKVCKLSEIHTKMKEYENVKVINNRLVIEAIGVTMEIPINNIEIIAKNKK